MFVNILRDCMVTGQYDVSKEIVKILRDYTKVLVFLFEEYGRYYVDDINIFPGWQDSTISDVIAVGTKFYFYAKVDSQTMICEYDTLIGNMPCVPSFQCHPSYNIDISERYMIIHKVIDNFTENLITRYDIHTRNYTFIERPFRTDYGGVCLGNDGKVLMCDHETGKCILYNTDNKVIWRYTDENKRYLYSYDRHIVLYKYDEILVIDPLTEKRVTVDINDLIKGYELTSEDDIIRGYISICSEGEFGVKIVSIDDLMLGVKPRIIDLPCLSMKYLATIDGIRYYFGKDKMIYRFDGEKFDLFIDPKCGHKTICSMVLVDAF